MGIRHRHFCVLFQPVIWGTKPSQTSQARALPTGSGSVVPQQSIFHLSPFLFCFFLKGWPPRDDPREPPRDVMPWMLPSVVFLRIEAEAIENLKKFQMFDSQPISTRCDISKFQSIRWLVFFDGFYVFTQLGESDWCIEATNGYNTSLDNVSNLKPWSMKVYEGGNAQTSRTERLMLLFKTLNPPYGVSPQKKTGDRFQKQSMATPQKGKTQKSQIQKKKVLNQTIHPS